VRDVALVAGGGALGSVLRWLLSGAVQRWTGSPLPWGTFAVNALGSLLIGLFAALALERALIPPSVRVFVIPGVLGGFTTFSAFSYETVALLRENQWTAALAYAAGSVAVGIIGAFVGLLLGARA
jgi:fluoride exporter